jgi:hypothetical protein
MSEGVSTVDSTMSGLDWQRANERDIARAAKARRRRKRQGTTTAVHPNSMAARKWGRSTWLKYD